MAFGEFKSIKQVLQQYPLKIRRENFLPAVPLELPAWFQENLSFALERQCPIPSEAFLCESLIFPFLQQAWKPHRKLMLWSHQSLVYDDNLFGEPDYFFTAWRDEVLTDLISIPLLAVAEAKRQDFDLGWGQCLAEMIACQKINQKKVFGLLDYLLAACEKQIP